MTAPVTALQETERDVVLPGTGAATTFAGGTAPLWVESFVTAGTPRPVVKLAVWLPAASWIVFPEDGFAYVTDTGPSRGTVGVTASTIWFRFAVGWVTEPIVSDSPPMKALKTDAAGIEVLRFSLKARVICVPAAFTVAAVSLGTLVSGTVELLSTAMQAAHAGGERGGVIARGVLNGIRVVAGGRVRVRHHDRLPLLKGAARKDEPHLGSEDDDHRRRRHRDPVRRDAELVCGQTRRAQELGETEY